MRFQLKRQFLDAAVSAAACMVAVLMPGVASAGQGQGEPKRPNVLFMMCDQLTADALSCYGGPVETPHIDRLASEGVRFNQATCVTPFCSPTRASMITGMYPHAHGIVTNCKNKPGPGEQQGIDVDDITTEKILNAAGYVTHHYGKWHLYGDRLPYYPDMYAPGFEYTRDMAETFDKVRATDAAGWMDWYTWCLPIERSPEFKKAVDALGDRWKDAHFAEFITDMGRLKLPLDQFYDVVLGRRTADRIRALGRQDKPFMITCSFNGPHDPNVVPSPYYEMFDPAKIELPANRHVRESVFENNWSRQIVADLGEPGLREFLRIYYGTVKLLDDQVGRIIEALEAIGAGDDTIIVFTADHGDMMGGHGMVWKSTASFYDEIVRVPLIIRYPRRLQPQLSELATDSTDLMPTLLGLLNRPVPDQVQGQSLVPYLTGQREAADARQFTFSERVRRHPKGERSVLPGTKGDFMARGQGLKYIRYSHGDEYMYDLARDPGETRNVINDPEYASRRKTLSDEMNAWLKRTGWPG